jgi:hypothetical protein
MLAHDARADGGVMQDQYEQKTEHSRVNNSI